MYRPTPVTVSPTARPPQRRTGAVQETFMFHPALPAWAGCPSHAPIESSGEGEYQTIVVRTRSWQQV